MANTCCVPPFTANQLQCPNCGETGGVHIDPTVKPAMTACPCGHRGSAPDWIQIYRLKSDLAAEDCLPTCSRCRSKTRAGIVRVTVDKKSHDLCQDCAKKLESLLVDSQTIVFDPYWKKTPSTPQP